MGIVKDNLEKQYEEDTQVKETQITNLEARIESMKTEMANTQRELVMERTKNKLKQAYGSLVISQSSDGAPQDPDDLALLKSISYQEEDSMTKTKEVNLNEQLEKISEQNSSNLE